MRLLAIDTANATCSAALYADGALLCEKIDMTPSKQAERLFPLINNVFEETGYSYASLTVLAVTVGPGSFTGIRIGMAAARGIALAAKLPIIGVTSLEAAAWPASQGNKPVLVVLDARRGQVYTQYFSIKAKSEAALIEYAEMMQYLPPSPFILAGSGANLVLPLLQQHQADFTISEVANAPTAANVAQVAALKYPGLDLPTLPSPKPFYLRKPDAKPQAAKLLIR